MNYKLRDAVRQAIIALDKPRYQQGWYQRAVDDAKVVDALRRVLAEPVEEGSVCARCGGLVFDPVLVQPVAKEQQFTTCNCRWDGETQVQQCTLHKAQVDAIHDWAERAKTAEAKINAEQVREFAKKCPYCNFDGRNNCANVADEIIKNGGKPDSGNCSNYQIYGKRTPPQPPADVPLLTEDEITDCWREADQGDRSVGHGRRFARAIEQAVRQKAGLK